MKELRVKKYRLAYKNKNGNHIIYGKYLYDKEEVLSLIRIGNEFEENFVYWLDAKYFKIPVGQDKKTEHQPNERT